MMQYSLNPKGVPLLVAVFVLAMTASADSLDKERRMTLILKSAAFADGGAIPARYTCEGKDISPPLTWEGVPEQAKSLVLIVDDPDAPDPDAPKLTWVHWVLYNIPPETTGLPEGVKSKNLPAGTMEGMNDWKKTGYGGPAPPIGRHRYFHKLYALDTELEGLRNPTKAQVVAAMEGRVIAEAELMGTYQKSN
jgi:Raf kinase inhibitor-like YbhB/YbcL family protein